MTAITNPTFQVSPISMTLLKEILTICILPQILNFKACKTFYQALQITVRLSLLLLNFTSDALPAYLTLAKT